MKRRDLLELGVGVVGLGFAHKQSWAAVDGTAWRTFELTTSVDMPSAKGKTRLWLPVPHRSYESCQVGGVNSWSGNFNRAGIYQTPGGDVEAFFAEWDNSESGMKAEFVTRVSTRDYSRGVPQKSEAFPTQSTYPTDVTKYLKSTPHSPTDGIVLTTARKITAGRKTHLEIVQSIYDWIVENGSRDPDTGGCGTGDVVAMLESGRISGKCADLNGLFVALVKSMGIPARHSFGIRVAPSRMAKSLGTSSSDVTKAQHCRAEFYLAGHGWIPVDPSDVLKIILEENVPLTSDRIAMERKRLFGSWEMNWVAFNTEKDFKIAPAAAREIEFFMYPRAETEGRVWNHLDPKKFGYQITARELRS